MSADITATTIAEARRVYRASRPYFVVSGFKFYRFGGAWVCELRNGQVTPVTVPETIDALNLRELRP